MQSIGVIVYLASLGIASAAFAQATRPADASPLPATLAWSDRGELIPAPAGATPPILSIKDPSVVRFNDRWHVYATTASERGWQMVYLSFKDWADAKDAKPFFMSDNPRLRGYHCAPCVFYFEPQKKWYLVYQSQQPQFSTTDYVADPTSWSAPQDFFERKPASAPKLWIDYWVICDATHAYLFFTGDDGKFYRSRTTLAEFPKGMSEPVIAMEEANRFALFEGSATYKVKGADRYLTIVEAIGPGGVRYYRGFVADRLDGDWRPYHATFDDPFAGVKNVSFNGAPWTSDVSHGELIRDGYDQTMTIDPAKLQLLYQGRAPTNERIDYIKLPYRLGLLTLKPAP